MIWPMTVVTTIGGYMLLDIPGAFLGLLVGATIDRQLAIPSWRALWHRLRSGAASVNIPKDNLQFMLLGYLAKLNGRVLPVHIKQADLEMQRLKLSDYARQAAINAFSQGKNLDASSLAATIKAAKLTPQQAELIIASCWRLVWSERLVSQNQRQTIFRYGQLLGLVAGRIAALELAAKPASSSRNVRGASKELAAALAVLGLGAGMRDWPTIERSYRRLLSENHPDKLIGRGASAARIEAANQQTQQLHKAYRLLRSRLQD